ncbi:hypothetical protein VPH35_006562 [Triticum aestivum]
MGKFKRGSLNPPAQPPAVVDGGNNPPPASCLIDRVAYITDVTNASTATCNATDNYNGRAVTIQVTFVVADPPQVSYLCAHCIGSQFDYEPVLVATEGRLALLAIEAGQFSSDRGRDHYIYHAGDASRGIRPLLRRLPKPDPVPHHLHRFYDGFHLGLLLRPRPQPQGGIFLRPHGGYRAEEEEEDVSYRPTSSLGSSASRNHQQPITCLTFTSTTPIARSGQSRSSPCCWTSSSKVAALSIRSMRHTRPSPSAENTAQCASSTCGRASFNAMCSTAPHCSTTIRCRRPSNPTLSRGSKLAHRLPATSPSLTEAAASSTSSCICRSPCTDTAAYGAALCPHTMAGRQPHGAWTLLILLLQAGARTARWFMHPRLAAP